MVYGIDVSLRIDADRWIKDFSSALGLGKYTILKIPIYLN